MSYNANKQIVVQKYGGTSVADTDRIKAVAARAAAIHANGHSLVVVVSAIMGGIGLLMPCILGDGGRAAEEASSNYAYRIRKQYPAEGGA